MPSFTINDQSVKNSQPIQESRQKISKKAVIDLGMNCLQEIGSDPICKVCISHGGSCCSGCSHLKNGTGCTLRNTSCTAWLCGFLKYVLFETGHLQEWNDFWDQVPGQDHRKDFTPEYFYIQKSLHVQPMGDLSEALASDLKELLRTHITIGFIFELREKLDRYIDQFLYYKADSAKQTRIIRNIAHLSIHFPRFHKALSEYK
ncbi:hypothetical protein [Cohnella silvisoli]|uniref:DNA mismatch repair protein n=1 Tax=Cohnella silvisoli TaxID=2873699 RepID=A0ABV1L066_9BACL|nr:hypothetical protein [Cohnella silvisoli]MCD9024721.1 hypothetical protein [Cohnella silvisoli]